MSDDAGTDIDEMDLEAVRDVTEAARQLAIAATPRSAPCCAALPKMATCAGNAASRSNRTSQSSGGAMATSGYTTAVGAELLQYVLGAACVWNGLRTWPLALAVAAPSTI